MEPLLLDLLLASPPLVIGFLLTWRLVWPRWKLFAKVIAYFVAVGVLSMLVGHWSVVVGWLHQIVGMAFHVAFCRKHGFTWYAVEDVDRYVALSKAAVGIR